MVAHPEIKKMHASPCEHVIVANDFKTLEQIKLPGKNLAVLQRMQPKALKDFLLNLDLKLFPDIHTSFYSYEAAENLSRLLADISNDRRGVTLFIKDIVEITKKFCTTANTEIVRFSMQVVKDNMCKYFHSDYNNLRLMCTYLGKGTYWTANENVNRSKLGCRCNEEILIDQNKIYELEPFWLGIFKGEVFMNNAGNGIVHRSPPVNGIHERRILLRIDV